MISWARYPFARVALALMAGIGAYDSVLAPAGIAPGGLVGVLMVAALAWGAAGRWLPSTAAHTKSLIGAGLLLTFTAFGALLAALHAESLDPRHLLHQPARLRAWQGVVVAGRTSRPTYTATIAQVERVRWADGSWHSATGRVRLLIRRESGTQPPTYGDLVLVNGMPRRVAPPPNPGQFNYASYLRYRQIWHEQYAGSTSFRVFGRRRLNPLKGWALGAAERLGGLLRHLIATPREAGLLQALVLGVTDDLPPELKAAYGATGTAHVLAVSGLHIGLLFTLVLFFLGKNTWYRRGPATRFAILALLLALVWGYALLTGLSASVLRAVVMSSLVAFGRALGKRVSLYNTLAVAACVLLLIDPYSLFDAGFQLSFLAVLGIAYLQPKIAAWWNPSGRVARRVRDGLSVALAAQVSTAPLTLYYFHQFPVHFLFANLLAVPWSDMLLVGSLGLLGLAGISDWLGGALAPLVRGVARLVTGCTYGLNETIEAIGRLPGGLIAGIDLSLAELWLLYAALLTALLWLASRRRTWLVALVAVVALYAGSRLARWQAVATDRSLVVYAVRHHSAVGMLAGFQAALLTDSAVWLDSAAGSAGLRANLLPHLWQRGTSAARWVPLLVGDSLAAARTAPPPGVLVRALPDGNRLLAWAGTRLLVLDRPLALRPRANTPPVVVDYVLVRGKPWFQPSALARAVACRVVVFDGSGPAGWVRWQVRRLRAAGFRCYDVGAEGAFVRKL